MGIIFSNKSQPKQLLSDNGQANSVKKEVYDGCENMFQKNQGQSTNTARRSCKAEMSYNEYFMCLAVASARRSKDPVTKVGACIVNDSNNRVIGLGYNGFPNGCPDDKLPWHKSRNFLDSKHAFVCHAELNAVMNMQRDPQTHGQHSLTIYVTLFPCNFCAQVIIQAGIKRVVYFSDRYLQKPTGKASVIMFDLAGVKYEKYEGRTQFVMDLNSKEIM